MSSCAGRDQKHHHVPRSGADGRQRWLAVLSTALSFLLVVRLCGMSSGAPTAGLSLSAAHSFHCTSCLLCWWLEHLFPICTLSGQPCPSLPHLPRHRCSRPPLKLWALCLARQFRCRNVHHDDAPLNQLVGVRRTRTLLPVAGSGQRLCL